MKIVPADDRWRDETARILGELTQKNEAGEIVGIYAIILTKERDPIVYGCGIENQELLWVLSRSAVHVLNDEDSD